MRLKARTMIKELHLKRNVSENSTKYHIFLKERNISGVFTIFVALLY